MKNKDKKLFELQAQVFKALGHPVRLAVVSVLRDGEQAVSSLMGFTATEASNLSRHLDVLKKAGIVSHRREGLQVFYKLNMPCAISFFECVKEIVQARIMEESALLQ